MIQNRRFGALSSSADPQKMAKTVEALILSMSVLVVWAAQQIFGIVLTPDNVQELATSIGGLVAAIMMAHGIIRKFIVFLVDWWYRTA